jgi:hypothetical protein
VRKGRRRELAAAFAAAVFVSARAESPEEEALAAIARLAHDDLQVREEAQALLREIGPEAAFQYRRDVEGKDAEVAMRMADLLDEWGFLPIAKMTGDPRPCRLLPWERPEDVPFDWWFGLDDPRFVAWLLKESFADEQARTLAMCRADVPVSKELVELSLAKHRFAVLRELTLRPAWEFDPSQRDLVAAEAARHYAKSGSLHALSVLYAVDRAAAIETLRGRAPDPDTVAGQLAGDMEACRLLGEHFKSHAIAARVAAQYPSAAFTDLYVEKGAADHLARLAPDLARPALARLLDRTPWVAFRAATHLAALGEDQPLLDRFDRVEPEAERPADYAWGWGCEAFVAAAPRIRGEKVEVRLRKFAADPRRPDGDRAIALRALAARGRERDVTFVWSHLKRLPPDLRPEVAVALAGIGSAAGVGALVPLLTDVRSSPDLRVRANEALRRIAGRDFGYDACGPLFERCRAARRWGSWWRENRGRFEPDLSKPDPGEE